MNAYTSVLCSSVMLLVTLPALAQTCPPGIPRVAPDSRYIDHGNGTVTDQETGLMWKRCSEGQSGTSCTGTVTTISYWEAALQTAAASSFAGHSDWRLPSAKELQSLVETGCHSPAINTTRFPNTPNSRLYWSSTTRASFATFAMCVSLGFGGVSFANKYGGIADGVRLVRAGQ